jgi:general secretion pathway protein G
MIKIRNFNKGFTLIELLIVIAIIGVLSTLLMANFIGVRQRARDAQRKSDIRQIQAALEIYRSDSGAYPPTGSFPSPCGSPLASGGSTYMQKIPCDPSGS